MSKPRLAIASDHAGLILRRFLIQELKDEVEFVDFGPDSSASVDYPDYAAKACKAVIEGNCERAILVCGTGIGMSIAANKINGIRAAHVESIFTARMSGEHNKANALCLGERVTGTTHALEIVRSWLKANFEARHQKRVDKIMALETKGTP
jgi:ribose 5-phosphate isomerase B